MVLDQARGETIAIGVSDDHHVGAAARLTGFEADREGHAYRLALPGRELPAGRGEAQRRAALEALALWV